MGRAGKSCKAETTETGMRKMKTRKKTKQELEMKASEIWDRYEDREMSGTYVEFWRIVIESELLFLLLKKARTKTRFELQRKFRWS